MYLLCMSICLYPGLGNICVPGTLRYLKSSLMLEPKAMDGCEPPCDAENRTCVLCNCSQAS